MDTQTIFLLCIAAGISAVAFFATRIFFGNSDGKLRDRLRHDSILKAQESAKQATADAGGIGQMLKNIGQAAARPFEPTTREKQSANRKRLAQAGIYSPSAARAMYGAKVIFLVSGVVGGYLAGMAMDYLLLGMSMGGLFGYLAPTMWLKMRIKKQQQSLDRGLADTIDLLVVCVEAGLTIDSAMQRVGQEIAIAHPALAKEMEIAHMETRVGLSRAEALKNLGTRTGNESLKALATMLTQAERFGTSVANALRIHAESLRQARQHKAEEIAAKATVKLSFPVVLFIFPAVLIVLAGPAVLGLFNSSLFN